MYKLSNRFWFSFHGWCALPIWVLFCFICLTGTIAVVSHEITWLVNPNARASNPDNLPAKTPAELIAVVEKAYPGAEVAQVMVMDAYLINAVIFSDHDKPMAIAYVNQYSGKIQEVNAGLTFVGFMRTLHGWLLFPWQHGYSIGYYLVSAMSLVLLGSLISGLMIYKQFWKAFSAPRIRTKQGKKTLLADLHRLAGVWSIWFILIISLTGFWYLIQGITYHMGIEMEPHAPTISGQLLPTTEPSAFPVSLQQALHLAKQRYPNFNPSYIGLPEHNRDNYHLYGSGGEIFFDDYSYQVAVNPWQGQIMQASSPTDMNTLQTITHIVDPLHYGTFGGLWSKLVWFVFGSLLTGMSITGFIIWSQRLVRAKATTAETSWKKVEEHC
ncbi:PepSY-associated TM helix domain-containing protein [Shewanella dokdonensis]|uniref:PepSY domain-containing protein n=1 Tax=Shewanella dokdonensis TaxID=712036 RepID=A0ABX8DHY9_9GAMM|nr:PepSY-associated TM helix domain-containing protein [Shewanella dokdonensis]MCL1074445.1 PepSY domain-containing protein [Shewanella dokdonensis]QVK24114.1 PepSY domain-containing protein [Shewanella dokdonensis]